jgi:hypothetical protein
MSRFLLLLFVGFLLPQNGGYFQILTIAEKASIVDVDDLGNIYTISAGRLTLFNAAGKQDIVFDDKMITKNTALDIKDPDRILVFSKEFFKIFILNDLFRIVVELNLTAQAGLNDVTLACLSADENIWVYSKSENRLMKISDRGDFVTKSAIINDITGTKSEPNFLREFHQKLYLNIPRTGILEFDNQGNFLQIIPLKGAMTFCVAEGKICYVLGKTMKVYHIESGLEQITALPDLTYIYTMPDLHGSELFLYYADLNSVGVLSIPGSQ